MLNRLKPYWKETATAAVVAAGAAFGAASALADDTQSGIGAQPVAATNAPATGGLITSDIRNENEELVEHAPFSTSLGRLAIIMYGSDETILGAVGSAANYYATKKPGNVEISFLWAKDNDGDPNTALVKFFADGREYAEMPIGNLVPTDTIMAETYEGLKGADREILKPRMLAKAADDKPAPNN